VAPERGAVVPGRDVLPRPGKLNCSRRPCRDVSGTSPPDGSQVVRELVPGSGDQARIKARDVNGIAWIIIDVRRDSKPGIIAGFRAPDG